MGCGCSRNVVNIKSRPPDLRGHPTVILEYTGDNKGSRTVNTPLGSLYKFDGVDHKRFTVLSGDVFFFTQQLGQFKWVAGAGKN